ncbi:MAG: hypothetical protein E7666_05950 [Ruminococcaceae bacterium]|nr:hypothetical protein [Oscillospiraceae bacterium]
MKKRTLQLLCLALTLLLLALPLFGCDDATPPTDTSDSESASDSTDTTDTQKSEDSSDEQPTEESETDDGYLYETHTYSTLTCSDQIKVIGRSTKTDKGITADWTGSGIAFNARCHGEIRITISSSLACKFKVFVDDKNPVTVSVSSGTRSYRVAGDLQKGEHSIRLLKQSAVESSNNGILCSIDSIEMTGDLLAPPANAPYLVEIIGDSITCGVGSMVENEPNAFGSYAYLFAEQMQVDYSIVSISGIGLLKSTGRHNGLTMLKAYSYLNYYRSKTEKYTPTRQADAVVINLNTNDKGSMTAAMEDDYKAAAKQLIQEIRAIHGADVKIIWVYGMMRGYNDGYCDIWADEVLAELGGEAAGYYSKKLPLNTQGVASHPNTKGHQKAAAVLADFFKTKELLPTVTEK